MNAIKKMIAKRSQSDSSKTLEFRAKAAIDKVDAVRFLVERDCGNADQGGDGSAAFPVQVGEIDNSPAAPQRASDPVLPKQLTDLATQCQLVAAPPLSLLSPQPEHVAADAADVYRVHERPSPERLTVDAPTEAADASESHGPPSLASCSMDLPAEPAYTPHEDAGRLPSVQSGSNPSSKKRACRQAEDSQDDDAEDDVPITQCISTLEASGQIPSPQPNRLPQNGFEAIGATIRLWFGADNPPVWKEGEVVDYKANQDDEHILRFDDGSKAVVVLAKELKRRWLVWMASADASKRKRRRK